MNEGGEGTAAVAATAPVTQDQGQSQSPASVGFLDVVPESYRDKPWVKDTARSEKPFDSFFKQFEDAQAAIGKNSQSVAIPTETSTPEEITAYNKAIGVPDNADGYTYKAPDISKEPEMVQNYLKANSDDTFMKGMREEAHKLGISDKQFNGLAGAFDATTIAKIRAVADNAQQQATEREGLFKKTYGDKAEYVDRIAKEVAGKVLPDNIKAMGDPQITIFELCKFIHEKVYKNDSVAPTGGTGGSAGGTEAEGIRAEIDALRKTTEFNDPMHKEHATAIARSRELYAAWHTAGGKR